VIPTATGLTAARSALIAGMASGMARGSWPSRSATRLTAEIRSRRRVNERPSFRSSALRTVASVAGLDALVAAPRGFLAMDLDFLECEAAFLDMIFILSGGREVDLHGLGRTDGDGA